VSEGERPGNAEEYVMEWRQIDANWWASHALQKRGAQADGPREVGSQAIRTHQARTRLPTRSARGIEWHDRKIINQYLTSWRCGIEDPFRPEGETSAVKMRGAVLTPACTRNRPHHTW